MAKSFNKLKLIDKIEETADSCSFLFEMSDASKEAYKFKAGQYLTLKLELNNEEHRRSYSIYTPTYDQSKFGFTVKRVSGGKISNYLIDHVKVGQELDVMTPDGKFALTPERQIQRDHYFIAGGSGITPIMSMVSTVLEEEPLSTCHLLYANRNEDNIIFRSQLDRLAEQHANQLTVTYILSQPAQEKAGGIKGLFGKKAAPKWKGLKGRIDNKILDRFFDEYPTKSRDNLYYLCGPGGLIKTIESYLENKQIDRSRINKEYFTVEVAESASNATATGNGGTAEVKLNGEKFSAEIPAGKTILDALIDLGKDPPFSCTSGACSTCVAKVTEGKVEMEACFALDDDEIAEGYVLTCQSHLKSATLKIDFDA